MNLQKYIGTLDIGEQISIKRMASGLTQMQLAKLVKTKQPSIARLENCKSFPNLNFLQKVAKALGYKIIITLTFL